MTDNKWGKWEDVYTDLTDDNKIIGVTRKMKVPGGWIIQYSFAIEGFSPSVSICFVPDNENEK